MRVNMMPKEEQRKMTQESGSHCAAWNGPGAKRGEGRWRDGRIAGIWGQGAKGIEGYKKEGIFGILDLAVKSTMEKVDMFT